MDASTRARASLLTSHLEFQLLGHVREFGHVLSVGARGNAASGLLSPPVALDHHRGVSFLLLCLLALHKVFLEAPLDENDLGRVVPARAIRR